MLNFRYRLRALAAEGKPIVTAVFPHADHGICEYETKPDGTRTSTRNADGYFTMMRDFIRLGSVGKHYGTSVPIRQSPVRSSAAPQKQGKSRYYAFLHVRMSMARKGLQRAVLPS